MQHATRYRDGLKDVEGLTLPATPPRDAHVWHLFVVLVEAMPPNEFCSALKDRGVATGRHYHTPVHLQPAYTRLGYHRGDFPVAERVASTGVSLPMAAELTYSQIDYVIGSVREVLGAS